VAFCFSRIDTGSGRSGRGFHSAWLLRGTFARNALPMATRSSTEGRFALKLSISELPFAPSCMR
jgi:hypothetical protein